MYYIFLIHAPKDFVFSNIFSSKLPLYIICIYCLKIMELCLRIDLLDIDKFCLIESYHFVLPPAIYRSSCFPSLPRQDFVLLKFLIFPNLSVLPFLEPQQSHFYSKINLWMRTFLRHHIKVPLTLHYISLSPAIICSLTPTFFFVTYLNIPVIYH